MKGFSEQNFELKVYLKYIIDKSRDNKPKKCIIDYIRERNIEEIEKYCDRYEFTYINLKRLETTDEELKPLMKDFIEIYEMVENELNNIQIDEDNKKKILVMKGNDINE